jgi:hypothetical protein
MSIIIRIVTGALQDADNNSYHRVVQVYLVLAAGALVVGAAILIGSFMIDNLAVLQWTRHKRMTSGAAIIERIRERSLVIQRRRTRNISLVCFGALILLVLGSWVAYIWGAVTGNS